MERSRPPLRGSRRARPRGGQPARDRTRPPQGGERRRAPRGHEARAASPEGK